MCVCVKKDRDRESWNMDKQWVKGEERGRKTQGECWLSPNPKST